MEDNPQQPQETPMLKVKVENTRHSTTTTLISFNQTTINKWEQKLKNRKIVTHVNIDTKTNNNHMYLEQAIQMTLDTSTL
jgi:hypothetical protein